MCVCVCQGSQEKGFSPPSGTGEAVGVVFGPRPDDISTMEDRDWPIGQDRTWRATRYQSTVPSKGIKSSSVQAANQILFGDSSDQIGLT